MIEPITRQFDSRRLAENERTVTARRGVSVTSSPSLSRSVAQGVCLEPPISRTDAIPHSESQRILHQSPSTNPPTNFTPNRSDNTLNPELSTVNRHAGPGTEHEADPISASVRRKHPNPPVRTPSLVVISLDPHDLDACGSHTVMEYQPSPFLRVDQAVSNIEECPGQRSPPSSAVLRARVIDGR